MGAVLFEERLLLRSEGDVETGDVQANGGTLGHLYLFCVLTESPENTEGAAKRVGLPAKNVS